MLYLNLAVHEAHLVWGCHFGQHSHVKILELVDQCEDLLFLVVLVLANLCIGVVDWHPHLYSVLAISGDVRRFDVACGAFRRTIREHPTVHLGGSTAEPKAVGAVDVPLVDLY